MLYGLSISNMLCQEAFKPRWSFSAFRGTACQIILALSALQSAKCYGQAPVLPSVTPITSPPYSVLGVNIASRRYKINVADISVGPKDAQSKIEFIRTNETPLDSAFWGVAYGVTEYQSAFSGGWTHNFNINLQCSYTSQDEANDETGLSCGFYAVSVSIGANTEVFDLIGNVKNGWYNYNNRTSSGSILRSSVSQDSRRIFQYIDKSGTIYEFVYPESGAGSSSTPNCGTYCWYAKSVTFRDGERLELDYEGRTSRNSTMQRLKSVISNRGFGLRFSYVERAGQYFNIANIDVITAFSRQCDTSCTDIDLGTARYQYTAYTGSPNRASYPTQFAFLSQYTDPAGRTQRYDYASFYAGSSGTNFSVFQPAAEQAAKISYDPYISEPNRQQTQQSTLTDGVGIQTKFTWTPEHNNARMIVRDGLGNETVYGIEIALMPSPNPYDIEMNYTRSVKSVTDPLGKTTSFKHDEFNRVKSVTRPEGDKKELEYNASGDISIIRSIAKDGSGLPILVSRYEYLPCSYDDISQCHNMAYSIDPRGNRTDYGWTGAGLLQSKMAPNDSNGVRSTSTLSYTAFPGIGGGTIYLLTSRTDNISASEHVTTNWSYDPKKGYALREKIISASGISLRTCFQSDNWGNRISETKPAAGLAACP